MTNVQSYLPFFHLLQRYYAGLLRGVSAQEWHSIAELGQNEVARQNESISSAIEILSDVNEEECEAFEYEFNRLFVGPGELVAAPYETIYTSGERVLMQSDTLAVRRAYAEYGMEVDEKNEQPDDHFAYEYAFCVLLIGQGTDEARDAYARFMREHVGRWTPSHVEVVRKNSENKICLAFADIAQAATDFTW